MGWGIIINGVTIPRVSNIDAEIIECEERLKAVKDRILQLVTYRPNYEELNDILYELNEQLEELEELNWKLPLLYHAKENPEDITQY